MSFRPFVLLAALPLVACDMRDEGPMQTAEKVFEYVTPAASGSTLYIRSARGNFTIEPATDDTLRIIADAHWRGAGEPLDGISISATQVPGGTLVCATWGGRRSECTTDNYHADMSGRAGRRRVAFKVKVPAGVQLDILGIDGDIVSASSARVKARMVNGDVTVVTAVGPVQAETVNGDVDARMTTVSGTDSVIAKTLNGDAYVFLPEAVNAKVAVSVAAGSVETDFASLIEAARGKSQLYAQLGTGALPVVVKSINGTVGLRRLDAQGRAFEMARP
jgi:hypothetical protein